MNNKGLIFTLEEVAILLQFCDDKLMAYLKDINLTRQELQALVRVTIKLDAYERYLRNERFKNLLK